MKIFFIAIIFVRVDKIIWSSLDVERHCNAIEAEVKNINSKDDTQRIGCNSCNGALSTAKSRPKMAYFKVGRGLVKPL